MRRQLLFYTLSLVTSFYLCVACSKSGAQIPPSTSTAHANPSSVPTLPRASPSPAQHELVYDIVYEDESFSIWQTLIGSAESIKWTQIPIPENRITGSSPFLDVEYEQYSQPTEDGFRFAVFSNVPAGNNVINTFVLESEYLGGGGNAELKKNGQVIWRGYMNGGVGLAIHSVLNLDGEFIFSYSDYSDPKPDKMTDYIVYSEGDKAVIVPSAFVPNIVNGELIYFKRVGNQAALLRKGLIIGEFYDIILQACCGYESDYGVANNGKIVDFFAIKDNDWYHVQAGFQE